jgi:hypothetical protein
MSDVIKFTEEEMQEIAGLQAKYQQKIFELGQLQLQEIDLEQTKKAFADKKTELLDSWKVIQKEEETVLNKLAAKYGNGSLNLRDGTFKAAPPTTTA